MQVHQTLLRKFQVEVDTDPDAAGGAGGGAMLDGLGYNIGGMSGLAATEAQQVTQQRSLDHLAQLIMKHDERIAHLVREIQRVEEHLTTQDVAMQNGGNFNPSALKDAIKLQYDTFIAAGESVGSLHAEVEQMCQRFAEHAGFTLGGEGDIFIQADREYYERKNRFKKSEQLERRRLENERDRERWNQQHQQQREQMQLYDATLRAPPAY